MVALIALAAIFWLLLLGLPWQPWRMRERFEAAPDRRAALSDITVLIPARNEAAVLGATLAALAHQGDELRVIVIDDNSDDETAAVARAAMGLDIEVISGRPLPDGWTGKPWALEQGRQLVITPRVLLLDADITLVPGTIAGLRDKAEAGGYQLVSLMAALRMQSVWERLLMPAFIYFFKLIYPFALSNAGSRHVAAAAGGCMLLDARLLSQMGGFASIADTVIDDCALAAGVRGAGGRSWVGVTHAAISRRGYDNLAGIAAMVERSAFTQLRYSSLLLVACSLLMGLMFWIPVLGLFSAAAGVFALALTGWIAMTVSYLPTLAFYRLSWLWALTLPLIAALYLVMTWRSAFAYWRGRRSAWRGRIYLR